MAKRRPVLESLEARLCMAAPALQTSFQLPLDGSWTPTVYRSSPLFVDIFGTGKDELIAVAANARLVAYAEGPNGTATPVVTYQVPGGMADIKSTPIVVTDPRTGQKDLFAAMGRDENHSGALEDGRLFGWNLRTGQLLPGWTQGQSTGRSVNGLGGVYGSLTSGALEGNGLPDIVATSFSQDVTAFRLDGSTLWRWSDDDTVLSGAVIGDIDRTGVPSVIVGGDSSSSPFYQAGGWVNVLSNTGTLKWRHFIPGEVTWSSPVLGDLNNNGYLDIVIGTGLNFDFAGAAGARAAGNNIYAFDPFGGILPGWPYHTTGNDAQAHEVLASPAIADLLGNGRLDVVAVDRSGYVHAVAPDGQPLPGFAGGVPIAPQFAPGTLPDNFGSPIIADVTGSYRPEIVAPFGPFLAAISAQGVVTTIATTNVIFPSKTPEGIDAAAAVGNFDGGPNLTLALVTYNAALGSRPDQVQVFSLPQTGLVPPWPTMRRTVAGDAVMRSPTFDHAFVVDAFNAAMGHLPDPATLANFENTLDADTITLLQTAQFVNASTPARQAEVQRIFGKFLGIAPDSGSLNYWTGYLASNTYRNMEVLIASGPDFARRSGNTPSGEVSALYQAIFNRAPSAAELNYWSSTNLPPGQLANIFLNVPAAYAGDLASYYPLVFGAGAQNNIPADALAAYAYDIRRGAREEVVDAAILASNGQYAAANDLANYVRDVYRDVLKRQPSAGEVANWVQAVDQGGVAKNQIAFAVVNSTEARVDYVQQEFAALLGRFADPSGAASFANYSNRENVILTIVGSAEYFNRNGGTNAAYVSAVFRDLASFSPTPQNVINDWVNRFNSGTPRVNLAQTLIYGGTLYFNNLAVNELSQYLPDESLGVLRSGNLPPGAAGQPINPDPNQVNYLVNQSFAGQSDEQLIALLLNTADYQHRVTYYKGILRSAGIRN